jgi:hypothetical protein
MNTFITTGLCHGVLDWKFGNCRKICVWIVMVNYGRWWAQHTRAGVNFRWRQRGSDLQNQRVWILDVWDAAMVWRDANCIWGTDRRVATVLLWKRCWSIYATTQAILEHFSYVTWITTFRLRQVVPVIKPRINYKHITDTIILPTYLPTWSRHILQSY